jgi:hypothetical protein
VEEELVEYLLMMKQKYICLVRLDVRMASFQVAKNNSLETGFSEPRGYAGEVWLCSFLDHCKTKFHLDVQQECHLPELWGSTEIMLMLSLTFLKQS